MNTDFLQNLPDGFILKDIYRIERVLGQGGFGITYLAIDTTLNRKVAIKEFFPKDYCTRQGDTSRVTLGTANSKEFIEQMRSKFIKEAINIAKLDYPNIIRIITQFEANGTAYYVMDYIEGTSLNDLIATRGPMNEQVALANIEWIGNALEYIHAKKINHLDVKPSNVMIRRSDNLPILIDFGLSKQYDAAGQQTSHTPTGISYGYAPLEQYDRAGLSEFSPETDIYSLAATLYYMMTGATPPPATALIESGITFPESIPQHLHHVIAKAMASNRANRYHSVSEFLYALKHARETDPGATIITPGGGGGGATGNSNGSQTTIVNNPGNVNNQNNSGRYQPPTPEKKSKSWLIALIAAIVVITAAIVLVIAFSGKKDDQSDIETIVTDTAVEEIEEEAPLETIRAESEATEDDEGRGGFDDNAYGYFQQYAGEYINSNRKVNFSGYFEDSDGTEYPITLRFNMDNDWNVGSCLYTNVNYNVKLTLSTQFTEDEMIVSGMAGTSHFEIRLSPTSEGAWAGSAVNGNHRLKAYISPKY